MNSNHIYSSTNICYSFAHNRFNYLHEYINAFVCVAFKHPNKCLGEGVNQPNVDITSKSTWIFL